jgi:hypothetical protein
MPIIGASRREDVAPRFKSLGKLKKGAPKGDGLRDLEYFRFAPKDNDATLMKAFAGAYGEEPVSLQPIYLPHDTMEQNFSSWRELYGQNGLCKVRCNGSEWVDWIEGNAHRHGLKPCDKEFKDTKNRCPECPLKPVGRLEVILPELWYTGHIGLVTVETHSWNDIATIAGKLVQWEPLQGRPFILWREDTRIGVPIGEKRAAVEKSLIKIELTDERLVQMLESSQRAALVAQNPTDGPDWDEYADLEVELAEFADDEPPDIDYDGHEIDADAYDDLKEEQRIGKDPAELIAKGKAKMAEDALPAIDTPPNDWTEFYSRCTAQLNYQHRNHASKVKDEIWLQDPRPTWAELWEHMINHQHEKGRL